MTDRVEPQQVGRREFLKRGARLGLIGLSLPALLEACARETPRTGAPKAAGLKDRTKAVQDQARPLVGDIVDFRLTSDEWEGAFGFVRLRLHRGSVDGNPVYYIRTDASDQAYASQEKLVYVPKLAPLAADGLSGRAYLFLGGVEGQPTVFSSQPGLEAFTPAWRIHRVTWRGTPRLLGSVSEVEQAEGKGEVSVERSAVVVNAAIVKWSGGELATDRQLKSYLGQGQLIEPPDTKGMTVTFKLHECFPETRYIVTDHSIEPAAKMTATNFAPRLQGGPTRANATGRTNVFMNGIKGTGPMGFQPSAFDFAAGDPAWSPYWDHWAYRWKEGVRARLLTSQRAVHQARDAGELEEFPGVPDTRGEVFTVNCPGPVRAPNAFTA